MNYKVIKTETEHKRALEEAERLIASDPALGSPDADRLELVALLLEDYERKAFQFGPVDAVEAIEFRMMEQDLKQRDLVPMLGSRSRVSEVLARKRPLTVQMIRALSHGLGISAESLLGKDEKPVIDASTDELDWSQFPYKEMEKRGWFATAKVSGKTVEDRLRSFLAQVVPQESAALLFRRRFQGEKFHDKSYYSVLAWTARVLARAKPLETKIPRFDISRMSMDVMRDLARLSWFSEGPKLAVEFLAKCGIVVVVESKLPNAIFDGAAMLSEKGVPVIGLTMRIDRVDYFWFTLLHEVAHVWKHLSSSESTFVDRIEAVSEVENRDSMEKEANRIAREAFIRRAVWERCSAKLSPTKENIQELADHLHIHPAIVAGRIQFESGQYEMFREFVGQGSVAKLFSQ